MCEAFSDFLEKIIAKYGDCDAGSTLEDMRLHKEDFSDFLLETYDFGSVQVGIIKNSLSTDMILRDIYDSLFV